MISGKDKILICEDEHHLARIAADHVQIYSTMAVEERDVFTVALAGGNTPGILYTLLKTEKYSKVIPWQHTHIFWGDERYVPSKHEDSNFRMAQEKLLSHVDVAPGRIHRYKTELTAHECALDYENILYRTFNLNPDKIPQFDLIILGIGDDGHTASLFPETQALGEKQRLVVVNKVDKLNASRLTFTYPLLNNAKHILILVSGNNKAGILKKVFSKPVHASIYPIQRISPASENLLWLIDKPAAHFL